MRSSAVQPVADPGNATDYVRLVAAGTLIDLAGRPLCWEPCPDCQGERTSGMTCPMAVPCRHCGAKPRAKCKRPSDHDAAEPHKARYDDAEADNKSRAAAGDLTVPAPWPTRKKEVTVPTATATAPRQRRRKTTPASAQGDLLAELTGLADFAVAIAAAAPASRDIALADVEWGAYGELAPAGVFGPDGSPQRRKLRGYITKQPRVFTAGEGGTNKPKFRGKPMLSLTLEMPPGDRDKGEYGLNIGLLAKPEVRFRLLDPPADRPLDRQMSLTRRVPVADLRPRDVFYLWQEPGLDHTARDIETRRDDRPRYHVQSEPQPPHGGLDGDSRLVEVLVNGTGEVVRRRLPAYEYVDVEDPRTHPWKDVTVGETYLQRGKRLLLGVMRHLNPTVEVEVDDDGTVTLVNINTTASVVISCFGRDYERGESDTPGRYVFRPVGTQAVLGGIGDGAGDGLDEVRAVLSASTLDGTTLALPDGDLHRPVWEKVHAVLTGMGAKGGSRRNQPYRFEIDRRADLLAFVGGGPAPKPERTTAGWVRTPDALAADVVARFVTPALLPSTGKPVRWLEPSAGDGSLVRAVVKVLPGSDATTVEPVAERADRLEAIEEASGLVYRGTFEEYAAYHAETWVAPYDLVVMNPPYSVPGNRTLWIDHVRLAWSLLAEGGQLVAIVPGRPERRADKKTAELLTMLGRDVLIEALPPKSFHQYGTDVDTAVIAAVKPTSDVTRARQRYARNLYRPAEGEPVRVEAPKLNAGAAALTPVQVYSGWGGETVVRYVGVCIGCGVSTWSDGSNDPRGQLGTQASSSLRAEEFDMVGPDVARCWACRDSGLMNRRTEDKARMLWERPVEPEPEVMLLFDLAELTAAAEDALAEL